MTDKLVKSTKLGVQPIRGLAMCSLVWQRQVRCNLFVNVYLFKMPNRIKIVKNKALTTHNDMAFCMIQLYLDFDKTKPNLG